MRCSRRVTALALAGLVAAVTIAPSAADAALDVPTKVVRACGFEGQQIAPFDPVGFNQQKAQGIARRVRRLAYSDGVLYAGGNFKFARNVNDPTTTGKDPNTGKTVTLETFPIARAGLAACDPATGTITPWYPGAVNGPVMAMAVIGNWVYFGGDFTKVGGLPHLRLARADKVTGKLDRTFMPVITTGDIVCDALGANCQERTPKVRTILPAPDGGIYVGGDFRKVNGTTRLKVAKFLPDGSLDAAFKGQVGGGTVWSLALIGDSLVFGGQFGSANGLARPSSVARVSAATGLNRPGVDDAFVPDIVDTNPIDPYVQVWDMNAVPGDANSVLLCIDSWTIEGIGGGDRQRSIGRFNLTTGRVDRNFLPWTDGGVQACTFNPAGDVVILGGHFESFLANVGASDPSYKNRSKLAAATLANGAAVRVPEGDSAEGVWTFAWLPGGVLAVGGDFTNMGYSKFNPPVTPFQRTRSLAIITP